MTKAVPFALVDVFAAAPLTGNRLPLVSDATDLCVVEMQAIARQFH